MPEPLWSYDVPPSPPLSCYFDSCVSKLNHHRGGTSIAGEWDGSFGAETNPKAGGPQSDWIKKNAKSGGARNEEYYGKVLQDGRKTRNVYSTNFFSSD